MPPRRNGWRSNGPAPCSTARRAATALAGVARARAVAAARPASGPGLVRSVEREGDGSIEVNVLRHDQVVVEVELDRRLHVTDVDEETPADE